MEEFMSQDFLLHGERRKRCFINTQKEIPLSTITTICHPEILPSTVSFVI